MYQMWFSKPLEKTHYYILHEKVPCCLISIVHKRSEPGALGLDFSTVTSRVAGAQGSVLVSGCWAVAEVGLGLPCPDPCSARAGGLGSLVRER